MIKDLSAVIVGSRSGRHLKTPVPLLPFGEETVLQRTLNAYLTAGFNEIILVQGYRSSEVQASLGTLANKIQFVGSSLPDEDFGTVLRRGIEKLSPSAKAFAVGLGDQPLLTSELVGQLAERFAAGKSKILVPVCQGFLGHPVFFDISLAAEFKKLPAHGETWDVIKAHGTEVLDYGVYHTAVIRHIEDVDDYHDLLRLAGLPVPEPAAREAEGNGGPPFEPPPRHDVIQSVGRVEIDPTE
jgi:molybdenum cofactor cytidylyltransferase